MKLVKPAPGGNFMQLADHLGDILVAVGPVKEADFETSNGPADVARCKRLVVLDLEGTVLFDEVDQVVFGKAFAPSLWRGNADQDDDAAVPCIIGQGEPGKAGRSPAWLALPCTPEAEKVVEAWLEAEQERLDELKAQTGKARGIKRLG